MAKKKKSTRWEELAKAGEELNKVLGLVDDQGNPGIPIDNATEEELEEKLLEAIQVITEDDEFSEATAEVLESLIGDEEEDETEDEEEPEVVDEEETEDEDEEFDDSPEASIDNLIMEVKVTKKRKELRKLIQTIDTLEPLRERLPELKSSQALKGATLKFLEGLNEEVEEVPEPKQKAKKAPAKKPKKAEEVKDLKPAVEATPVKKKAEKKKAPKKSSGKTKTQEAIEYITPFIEEGKYIERELSEMIAENTDTIAWATAHMLITKAKNPKYCKFDRVLQKDPNTNLVSFKND